jgi:hypothetical protein
LLHIDIKKFGSFDKASHRVTGDRSQPARNIGWDYELVAVDDHSRAAFTQVYPDEARPSASSSRRCANGRTAPATRIQSSAAKPCQLGRISTTGTAFTTASAWRHLNLGSRVLERTC